MLHYVMPRRVPRKAPLLLIVLLNSVLSFSQTYWKVETERGEQVLLTISVNEKTGEFEAFTRRYALRDIAGTLTYTVARTAGKIRYPEIVYIKGTTSRSKDTLRLTGTFYYIDKRYPFNASVAGDKVSGKFTDERDRSHMLKGTRVANNKPLRDYQSIMGSAIMLTERYIFNRDWLKSEEWQKFRTRADELKPLITDDYEIGACFYLLGRNLPFSPYEISRTNSASGRPAAIRKIRIREVNSATALIDAGMMPLTRPEMDSIAFQIEKKGYSRLVIDLRGRGRILPESVEYLTSYFAPGTFTGGIYLTRKWFDSNTSLPGPADYQRQFSSFSRAYTQGEFHMETGRYFSITPNGRTFRGKVYLLTDSRTAGAALPFIYLSKLRRIATIVGQKTSGSSVISERIRIDNNFSFSLAVSEYFTPSKKQLSEADIEPDILLHNEDALAYVLKNL